jgi:hypothetical protein
VTRLQLRPGLVVPVLAGVLACQPAPSPGDDEGDGEESSGGAGGSSEGEESSGEAPVDARYTYWRDIKAIVDARCATCHQPGTIAPFALQTADEVVALAPALRSSLELGTMPPWPPSAQCNTYAHDRSLPDAQRDMILAWVDDGAPVGDPADAPPPGDPGEQIAWDAELVMPEAYQTSGALLDDYRCFVMDWPLDQPKYVTGFEAVPDQPSIVHHVIAFVIPPDAAQTYKDLDDGEAGPGYTCYGGPGGGFSQQWLGAWAPGSQPSSDPDRGILVQPGSAVVLQMHYHPTPEPPADRSKIRVTLSDDVRYEQVVLPFTMEMCLRSRARCDVPQVPFFSTSPTCGRSARSPWRWRWSSPRSSGEHVGARAGAAGGADDRDHGVGEAAHRVGPDRVDGDDRGDRGRPRDGVQGAAVGHGEGPAVPRRGAA